MLRISQIVTGCFIPFGHICICPAIGRSILAFFQIFSEIKIISFHWIRLYSGSQINITANNCILSVFLRTNISGYGLA
ncbi:hypothetical protein [Nostoc sp.]|uniref:hypothetical protein n=1 Tax=Nostoc sp. TaxID=1180 RepID=UPI003FA5F13B